MSTQGISRCGSCGYQWPTGQNGSHFCSIHLLDQRNDLLRALDNTQALLERLGMESSDEYQANAAAIAKAKGETK